MPDDLDRIHDKLDDQTEKLADLGATMRMYMQNQNALNDSLAKGMKGHSDEIAQLKLKDAGAHHKCAEEIRLHEERSWAHDPKKALGLAGMLLGIVETVRGFFFHK
jgi:hypothetical protein